MFTVETALASLSVHEWLVWAPLIFFLSSRPDFYYILFFLFFFPVRNHHRASSALRKCENGRVVNAPALQPWFLNIFCCICDVCLHIYCTIRFFLLIFFPHCGTIEKLNITLCNGSISTMGPYPTLWEPLPDSNSLVHWFWPHRYKHANHTHWVAVR